MSIEAFPHFLIAGTNGSQLLQFLKLSRLCKSIQFLSDRFPLFCHTLHLCLVSHSAPYHRVFFPLRWDASRQKVRVFVRRSGNQHGCELFLVVWVMIVAAGVSRLNTTTSSTTGLTRPAILERKGSNILAFWRQFSMRFMS
jgi:hypothetical protein